jgi:hypothetical protein
MDPAIADRINAAADRLTERIARAEQINRAARERLERDAAEKEILRRERKTAIQANAVDAYSRWGESPPTPNAEQSPRSYRKRVLRDMQRHLPAGHPFGAMRLRELPDEPAALDVIGSRIEDAFARSYNDPQTVPEGQLREIRSEDHAGHKISSFVGRDSFISSMGAPCRKVVGGVEGLRRLTENLARWVR